MILAVIVCLPLLAIGVGWLPMGEALAPLATFLACAADLGLTLRLALQLPVVKRIIAVPNWVELDCFGALLLLLVAFVSTAAALFSWGDTETGIDGKPDATLRYYTSYNLFVAAMLSVPMLVEPALVWTAVELTTLFGVYLVAFENTQAAIEAAWKYSILTLMGGAIALLGFLVLYSAKRFGDAPFTWAGLLTLAPNIPPKILVTASIFILVGFGAKVGLVPLHTWLPDAHSQAPSAVCALLSSVKTTIVLSVIVRMIPILHASGWADAGRWILLAGLISTGVGAFLIVQVTDYKRLFAYSTVEHMGIILTAASFGGTVAGYGAVFQTLTHTITKALCFFASGATLFLVGTRRIAEIRGFIRRSPLIAGALLVGGIAVGGAPPFAVFLSEFSILRAGISAHRYIPVAILATFIGVAFFGLIFHLNHIVFGSPSTAVKNHSVKELPSRCLVALAMCAFCVVILGFYLPAPLDALLRAAAHDISR